MIIEYDPELKEQRFIEYGDILLQLGIRELKKEESYSLGSIKDPILALDAQGFSNLPNGELIITLFTHSQIPLITIYDKTQNQWLKLDDTWPPSIDTLVHLSGQRKCTAFKTATNILETACGSGMAGIYALNQNQNIAKIHFTDILPNCTKTAESNKKFIEREVECSYGVTDGIKGIPGKYDIIIASAVPATPSLPNLNRPINPLFEGTQLLEDLLYDSPEHLTHGGKLIISHSSLGEEAFKEAAKKYGANVDCVLSEKDVPFRVEFLGDQRWINFLVEKCGMKRKNERGYPYWHTVRTKQVSF